MDFKVSRSCQILRSKVEIEQGLRSIETEIQCMEDKKGKLLEELTCVSQWIDILTDSKKDYFFEKDSSSDMTVCKRIELLQHDQKIIFHKHQRLEEKERLNLAKKENLELRYQLLTMQENNLYLKTMTEKNIDTIKDI